MSNSKKLKAVICMMAMSLSLVVMGHVGAVKGNDWTPERITAVLNEAAELATPDDMTALYASLPSSVQEEVLGKSMRKEEVFKAAQAEDESFVLILANHFGL